ncbi:MAG: ankyrin repeat domain-containing protein [Gemmatimonadaceae bacterium]|jgi:ankyrin repeat protein|nr:ankyrin repeat domain-containing protein [Gemmatimonadaceae bacterium]MCC6431947.1 ankyrin repeat domain-containing protein [Gemmatimonadaceae bacterium]
MMLPRASDALLELIRAHDTAGVDAMLDADPVQRTHGGPGGETLVLYACYTGATDVAPLLRGARPYDACEAAALGDLHALNEALDRDADLISRRSSDGWTPLHLAGFFGRDECAAFLIDNGAPLDALSTNAIRNTPLHAALAGATNPTLVRRLIFAGADVESRGENGIQPLHLAASRGDQALCDLLIARGADPHAAMDDGTTPAKLAESRGFKELAEKLTAKAET